MEALLDESESLEAILMHDIRIHRNLKTGVPEIIETTVVPSVKHFSEEQYVSVDLQIILSEGYPEISPTFYLLKPRGLDDRRLDIIKLACLEKLDKAQGFPVVFDLIDVVREHLSGSNLPCGQCVICLYGFREGDDFIKTECYHFLHSYCLAKHLLAARKNYEEEQDKLPAWMRKASEPYQASCPVCREAIQDESESLRVCLPPTQLSNAPDFILTDELVTLQKKMKNVYIYQKKKGGIIDLEAEMGSIISIEPRDLKSADQRCENNHQSSNSFKEDGPLLYQTAFNESGCSGGTRVRNEQFSQDKQNSAKSEGDSFEQRKNIRFAPLNPQQRTVASPKNKNIHHSIPRSCRGRRCYYNKRTEDASQVRAP